MAKARPGFVDRMGQRIVYCESCGIRLCETDFTRGKARLHQQRPFCLPCRPMPAEIVDAIPCTVRRFHRYRLRASRSIQRPLSSC